VQMNHNGLLFVSSRDAEKAVHAVVDSDSCQHGVFSYSFGKLTSQNSRYRAIVSGI
jgi:hypothetical protein